MKRIITVLASMAVLAFAGCGEKGETDQQVLDRYRPRMDALREQLRAIHAKLPEIGTPVDAKKLDPPPVYGQPGTPGNTDFLAIEHLLDEYAQPKFDMVLSEDLRHVLIWSGSQSPLSPDSLKKRTKNFAGFFERAVGIRYLVVLRSHVDGVSITGENTFQGGDGWVEAYVVDLTTSEIVGRVSVQASPDSEVNFQTSQGQSVEDGMKSWVRSSTWTKLRAQLAEKLAEVTGGSFTFR